MDKSPDKLEMKESIERLRSEPKVLQVILKYLKKSGKLKSPSDSII